MKISLNGILKSSSISTAVTKNYKSKSRIINGKSTSNHEYPWVAEIKRISMGDTKFSGGTIVTHKSILTCGHCVCNQETHTCLTDVDNTKSINQNVENKNEIYYSISHF